jgi:hypothetical protein
MATKRLPRPRDPTQLAKLIVDIATGEIEDKIEDGRDSAAAELGRKGGKARAAAMTPLRRKEIATRAAKRRWSKEPAYYNFVRIHKTLRVNPGDGRWRIGSALEGCRYRGAAGSR